MRYIWIIFILRLLFTLADEECGPPPDLNHASAVTDEDNFPPGTEVKYKCNFGYYFVSIKRKATCEQDGGKGLHWNTEGIECRPVSCGEPELIENGQVLGSRYTYPNSVEYACNVGYKLKGINVRFCGTDGEWSGRKPSCTIVTCPKPEEIENGTVSYSSTVYNSIATYNCYDGLHIEGNNTVKCDAEGNWKGILPKCKEMLCPKPLQPLNGIATLMNEKRNVGSLVVYNCNSGFNLIGNTYAKCLATGKWSFETPKCASLCTVPKLGRGAMGKHEYRYFTRIKPETKIEHGKKLFLRCNPNYEIPTEEWYEGDVEITCNSGNFEPKPACHPARCRSPPPINGKGRPLENYENEHRSIVVYVDACLKSDIILQNKTARCNFGKWQVREARCKTTRCHPYTLNRIAGLFTKNPRYYESGEFLDVLCKEGYEKYINKIACKSGTWEIKSLPCKPVECNTKELQKYEGIKVENISIRNNEWYRIVCEKGYVNAVNYIQCKNYKWPDLPDELCKLDECNTKELQKYEGVKMENKSIKNNNWYKIDCENGYDNAVYYIWCKNHKWEDLPDEPCKPGNCVIPYVPNGEIKRLEIIERWWPKKDERKFRPVRTGSVITHGTKYFIFCNKPYKLQGIIETDDSENSIVCEKKQWHPKPECLLDIKTPIPIEFPDEDTTIDEVKTTDIAKQEATLTINNTFIQLNTSDTEEKKEIDLNNSNSLNKCIYQSLDDNLIAFLNGNRRIKSGHFVHDTHLKFGCLYPGEYRLRGPIESKCENGTWEPYLPSCHLPTKDDDVIITIRNKNFTVFPGNLIMVEKNTALVITCSTVKRDKWPRLLTNASKQEKVKGIQSQRGSFYIYIDILNMTNDYSGNYSCISPRNEHFVLIKVFPDPVKIQCPIPQNPKNGQVFYDSLTYNSEIRYECNYNYKLVGEAKAKCNDDGQWSEVPVCQGTCKHPGYIEHANIVDDNFEINGEIHYECTEGYRLIGNATLRCLITGEWTSQKPTCKEIRCPVPHHPENGEVDFYSLTYNSEITYKCRDGYKLIGEAKAKCQYDNYWSSTIPTCRKIQTCNVYDLIERLSEDTAVASNITEHVTNGTNVTLICAGDNLILLGQNYATCLNGLWKTGKIECVYGCYPIRKPENSSLILENYKESYRIGESIIFSCPEDEKLDGDLELIFCLHTGWSDNHVPKCIPLET
ncbi:sushi, von Willebrand factor type A, EGF and pentraxin domain-containing protein 1-like isoform X2 [Centruroides vittatus]|uniref:sushi, von Willebrand factor type A, EGF and pentraxin domain-containing protein 1-like isoform X2 n=1 Tax=Centruroides vittatus TaxID=120091 RepID=UPI00350FE4F8